MLHISENGHGVFLTKKDKMQNITYPQKTTYVENWKKSQVYDPS